MKMYWYPACGACRKARAHFARQGIEPELINLATDPPTIDQLRTLWTASGLPLRKFFNTSGQSWRNGDFSGRLPTMDHDAQLAALAADGMLVKRPIIVDGDRVSVGFKGE